MLAGP
jgi:hypothetical protein